MLISFFCSLLFHLRYLWDLFILTLFSSSSILTAKLDVNILQKILYPWVLVHMSKSLLRQKCLSLTLLYNVKLLTKLIVPMSILPAVFESSPSLHFLASSWCYQTWFIWTLMNEKLHMILKICILLIHLSFSFQFLFIKKLL